MPGAISAGNDDALRIGVLGLADCVLETLRPVGRYDLDRPLPCEERLSQAANLIQSPTASGEAIHQDDRARRAHDPDGSGSVRRGEASSSSQVS